MVALAIIISQTTIFFNNKATLVGWLCYFTRTQPLHHRSDGPPPLAQGRLFLRNGWLLYYAFFSFLFIIAKYVMQKIICTIVEQGVARPTLKTETGIILLIR